MNFSDYAKTQLDEAKKQFGEYHYYDKGASEVMDVNGLVKILKKISVVEAMAQLKHLANRKDTALDPTYLVRDILGSLDDDEKYEPLFEDEELSNLY